MKKKVQNKNLKPPQGNISLKMTESIRRMDELKQTAGKLVSLSPAQIHNSKKQYTRKQKHKISSINENS